MFLTIRFQQGNSMVNNIKDPLTVREIVNLSHNQAGIYWQSKIMEQGWILYGEEKQAISLVEYDERDISNNRVKRSQHYVLLKNLKENTDYYFYIVSNRGTYSSNRGQAFHFKTPKKSIQQHSMNPAYGKIILQNGKAADGILVLLKLADKVPLLAVSKATGEWLIPLNIVVEKKSGKINHDLTDGIKAEVRFISEEKTDTVLISMLADITPVAQTIILGKKYNLLAKGDVLSATTGQSSLQKSTLYITYPRENAIIPAGKPLFKGLGIAGNEVFVFINSSPQFSYRALVDEKGEWRVLPTQSIGIGSYTATITTKDKNGGAVTLKRNFMIAKSGEQVLGDATGEPSITTSPSPSPFPTYTTISVTPGVTTVTPSPTITVQTPTPSVFVEPTAPFQYVTPSPPRTGGEIVYLFYASILLFVAGAGLMLVF
ncbi:MAG: hypothetical protein WC489_02835 [Patescibacteria group bacterium]